MPCVPERTNSGSYASAPCDIGAIEFRHRDDHQHDEEDDQPNMDPATAAD